MSNETIPVTHGQMNLILMAVEHGFREHERGKNLQGALASVFELYRVHPHDALSKSLSISREKQS